MCETNGIFFFAERKKNGRKHTLQQGHKKNKYIKDVKDVVIRVELHQGCDLDEFDNPWTMDLKPHFSFQLSRSFWVDLKAYR
jgi:hypothetical protein